MGARHPPVAMTPSWLTDMAFTIARWLTSRLCRKSPFGSANFLMFSALALQKLHSCRGDVGMKGGTFQKRHVVSNKSWQCEIDQRVDSAASMPTALIHICTSHYMHACSVHTLP